MVYDLAIIGGGPAGYVAAERAGARGMKVILFEKKNLGGVCLNEGCIPTKTLLYQAKLYQQMQAADKYGIKVSDVSIDYPSMLARKDKIVRKLVGGVSSKMKKGKVEVISGHASIHGRSTTGIDIGVGDISYQASNLLICTGSEALIPKISGLDMTSGRILTNREILLQQELPETLAIIGGGVVGMEFACLFNSLGVKVSVIELEEKLLGDMDVDLSSGLQQILTKRGIDFHLSARLTEIKDHTLIFEKNTKQESLQAEKVLFSVGRKPVVEGFGLENLGVELVSGAIKVDKRMRTNIPNVFAAGDVTGFSMLAHTAGREGEVVVNTIAGREDLMRYRAIPHVVYTNPEVASVGLTESMAREKGLEYKLARLPMTYSGRFMAENDDPAGVCKVLVGEQYGEVLGIHMLGNPASEIIFGAAMAIEAELTLKEMEEIVFPHPTVSEIIRETVFSLNV